MAITTFPIILKWARMITPNVRHLAFARADNQILDFIPGQFITVHFMHEDKMLRRSYSLATVPGESDLIEFALSYFKGGAASEFLFNLEPGQTIDASGPYGRLVLRGEDKPKRYIFIATGTGVTPYRSMLPALEQRLADDPNLQIVLLQGVQGQKHALYPDEFVEFAKRHPRFDFKLYYSREHLAKPAPHECVGYVQTAFNGLILNPEQDIIYLCGNPHMIDNAVDLVKDLGFSIQQLRREKYVS